MAISSAYASKMQDVAAKAQNGTLRANDTHLVYLREKAKTLPELQQWLIDNVDTR